jgi:hypothetical protein
MQVSAQSRKYLLEASTLHFVIGIAQTVQTFPKVRICLLRTSKPTVSRGFVVLTTSSSLVDAMSTNVGTHLVGLAPPGGTLSRSQRISASLAPLSAATRQSGLPRLLCLWQARLQTFSQNGPFGRAGRAL